MSLCMVSVQERFIIKCRLCWRVYGTNIGMLQGTLENKSHLLVSAKRPKSLLKLVYNGVLFCILYNEETRHKMFLMGFKAFFAKAKGGKGQDVSQKKSQKCTNT